MAERYCSATYPGRKGLLKPDEIEDIARPIVSHYAHLANTFYLKEVPGMNLGLFAKEDTDVPEDKTKLKM